MKNKLKITVVGSTGYTGLDLVYLLSKHPKIKITYLCATKNLGKSITYFDKRIKKLPNITSVKNVNWDNVDLICHFLIEVSKLIRKAF